MKIKSRYWSDGRIIQIKRIIYCANRLELISNELFTVWKSSNTLRVRGLVNSPLEVLIFFGEIKYRLRSVDIIIERLLFSPVHRLRLCAFQSSRDQSLCLSIDGSVVFWVVFSPALFIISFDLHRAVARRLIISITLDFPRYLFNCPFSFCPNNFPRDFPFPFVPVRFRRRSYFASRWLLWIDNNNNRSNNDNHILRHVYK